MLIDLNKKRPKKFVIISGLPILIQIKEITLVKQ